MTDLSGRVEATKDHLREVEASPSSLTTLHPTRSRAKPQGSPDPDPDVAKEGQGCVAKRMR